MRGNKSQRAWIYVLVGAYLLYTAWQLFQGLGDTEGNQVIIGIFAVIFVIAGAALIWFSIRSMQKDSGQKEPAEEENAQEESSQEESSQEGSVQKESVQEDNAREENSSDTDREDGE